jgi:hypothetical protein
VRDLAGRDVEQEQVGVATAIAEALGRDPTAVGRDAGDVAPAAELERLLLPGP